MRGRLGTPEGNRALSAAQRQYDNETPEEDEEEAEEEDVEEEEKETASAKAARIELAALDNKLAEREEECKGLRAEVDKIEGWAFAAVARAEKAEAEVERLSAENSVNEALLRRRQEEVARLRALCAARPKIKYAENLTAEVIQWLLEIDAAGRGEGEK